MENSLTASFETRTVHFTHEVYICPDGGVGGGGSGGGHGAGIFLIEQTINEM